LFLLLLSLAFHLMELAALLSENPSKSRLFENRFNYSITHGSMRTWQNWALGCSHQSNHAPCYVDAPDQSLHSTELGTQCIAQLEAIDTGEKSHSELKDNRAPGSTSPTKPVTWLLVYVLLGNAREGRMMLEALESSHQLRIPMQTHRQSHRYYLGGH